jgi:hypothetical protein
VRAFTLLAVLLFAGCVTPYDVKVDVYAFAASEMTPIGVRGGCKAVGHYVLAKRVSVPSKRCDLAAGGDLGPLLASLQMIPLGGVAKVTYAFWYPDDPGKDPTKSEWKAATLADASQGRWFIETQGESTKGPPHGFNLRIEAEGLTPIQRSFGIGREGYQEYILVSALAEP